MSKDLLREYIKEQKFTSSDDILKALKQLFSDVVSELSSIKVKDITIKNNLGITETRNTNGYRYPVAKVEIFILEV